MSLLRQQTFIDKYQMIVDNGKKATEERTNKTKSNKNLIALLNEVKQINSYRRLRFRATSGHAVPDMDCMSQLIIGNEEKFSQLKFLKQFNKGDMPDCCTYQQSGINAGFLLLNTLLRITPFLMIG
uniref:Uncharacterized protein n=1 Tax=Glossina austeni TaxID=7395 RepID=A0A1A9VV60_GLOAU